MNKQDTTLSQAAQREDQASAEVTAIPLIASTQDPENLTLAEAQEILDEAVRRYTTLEYNKMLSCFSPDILVNYGNREPFRGIDALREYLVSRYGALTDMKMTKKARCVSGKVIGVEATITFTNLADGKKFEGRVFEFLEVTDGLISTWDNLSLYWEPEEAA